MVYETVAGMIAKQLKMDVKVNEIENNEENDIVEKYSTVRMCDEYRKIYEI